MPKHRITNADVVTSGNAVAADRSVLGVPVSNLVIESIVPVVASGVSVAASQSVGAAGSFILNGPVVVNGVAVFDVPRNVVAAWTGTAVVTVTGKDAYGATVVESSASGTSLTGKKAFKQITGIVSSAVITLATAGSGAVLGLAYRPKVGGFIRGILNENTADAGTYAAPERVASTATANDVRGTYAYAGTANGTNSFTVSYIAANGPTDADGFGIAQFTA